MCECVCVFCQIVLHPSCLQKGVNYIYYPALTLSGCLYIMFLCHRKSRVLVNYSMQSLSLFSHGNWVTSKKLVCSFGTIYIEAECVSICLFLRNF